MLESLTDLQLRHRHADSNELLLCLRRVLRLHIRGPPVYPLPGTCMDCRSSDIGYAIDGRPIWPTVTSAPTQVTSAVLGPSSSYKM